MKFVEITAIESVGKNHVYDLSMAEGEDPSFIANGVVVHNSAYSVFLETQDSYRLHLTDQIFYRKIFPLIATVNELFKDKSIYANSKPSIEQLLFDSTNRANMLMPKLHWNKRLEAKGEENMMDMLEKLEEKGVPVPLKMWMAAAGVDADALIRDTKDDVELRKELEKYTGKDTSHDQNDDYGMADDEGYETEASVHFKRAIRAALQSIKAQDNLTSTPMNSFNHTQRVGLANRKFSGDDALMYEPNKSGSGKKHIFNQARAKKEMHHKIAKIATQMDRDRNYRASVSNRLSVRKQLRKMKP